MKRNRKKSSTQDRSRPSTSDKIREENDLAYFVHDRVTLMREVFSILKPKDIKSITPECVRNLSIDNLEELCLEELLGISSKRLCAVLDGADPPSDTDSSTSSSSSSASDNGPAPTAVEDVICLDSDSTEGSAKIKKKKKKKKKRKRKRKSTDTTTNSDTTIQTVSTQQNNAKKSMQTSSKSIKTPSNNKNNDTETLITNAAILNQIGGRPIELFSEKIAGGKEKTRAAERVGMTVLEILEVQARARAIRAQLAKEQSDASQAGPSTSRVSKPSNTHTTHTKQAEDSDSEIEIKEEAAEVVNLLSSSDDEQKPRVEELDEKEALVPDTDPSAVATKSKHKTKLKKTKTANRNLPETITTHVLVSENKNEIFTPGNPGGNLNKGKANSKKNEEINLPNLKKQLPNSNNELPTSETQAAKPVCDEIKQEIEERVSSPDLIFLEDSDGEKTTSDVSKQLAKNSKNTEIKDIDAPITTKNFKSSHVNDFTITVKQNTRRKVRKDRNNVVISFSNDANTNETDRDGNNLFASTQNKNIIDRPSDIIEQSAKKLNSIVTKIIKERPKAKYIKSVVQKTNIKHRYTRTNTKDSDKTSDDKNKDLNREEEKEKESDGDEITLQLSDSEKMDLLEDLNPKNLDNVSVHSNSDTKSSVDKDSVSSSDETEESDQQNVNSTQDIVETEISSTTIDNVDVNEEINNKNDSSSIEITTNTDNFDINVTESNIDIPKQNDNTPKNCFVNEMTSKTSDITIPKTVINMEHDLRQPMNIIRRLRVDEMVLDASRNATLKCVPADSEPSTKINITAENVAKASNILEVNKVSSVKPPESHLTNENINDSCQTKDLNSVNKENNLNLIETGSIKDKKILPGYECDNESSLPKEPDSNVKEQEICIEKESTSDKTRKKKKKIRNKLNRKKVSCSSGDDIVESNIVCLGDDPRVEVKETSTENNKRIDVSDNAINIHNTKNTKRSNSLESSEQTKNNDEGLQSLQEIENLNILTESSSGKLNTSINDQNDFKTNELQPETLETDKKQLETDKKQLETGDISKETNSISKQTEIISIIPETKDVETIDCGSPNTSDCNSETIEIRAANVEPNKIANLDSSVGTKDGGEPAVSVAEAPETVKVIESNDVEEVAELEEGEITDDYKRELSEEGEINTDTESEIEAQDVVQETICISDKENDTTDDEGDKTVENKDSNKKSRKKNLCKKCKRKKNLRQNADQNFYRHSESDKDIKKIDKVLTINELPINKSESSIALLNNDVRDTRIINENSKEELVVDNVSIDSETDSDSESNNVNIIKTQSQNSKIDKFKLEIDNNISNIDLSSPNNKRQDSETLEISDDSSDCYEILSKEPTTEEIEALSEKIDRIDRIEVVTSDEVMHHELNNSSNEDSNNKITKNPENELKNSASYTSNDNDTEIIADENISWKDRYVKSKKVTNVLKTSNILNSLRKKNLNLKKKLLESKLAKSVKETEEIVEVVPETVEIGSIEHYNTLESSTQYVDPVQEHSKLETDLKEANLTNEPDIVKATDNETLVNTTTKAQIVTKEMKKEAKQLLKMYKKLIKHNDMFKEKDPSKKKKKKKNKIKDGDASCSSVVT